MAINKKIGKHSQAANDFLEPKAVTGLTVTDVGTSRAYNNGAFNVSWTLPADSPAATSYDISTTPSTTTTNVTQTSGQITGLSSATSYTVTVVAKNAVGNSIATTSSAVTATTVPQAPQSPTATAGVDQNTISWTAPSNGGSAITNYYITGNDGTTGNTTALTINIADTAGTSQYYNVYADNANGRSLASANTSTVTTLAPSFFSPPFFPPFFPPSFFAPPFFPPGFFAPPFFPPGFFAPPFFPPTFFAPPAFFAPPFFPPSFGYSSIKLKKSLVGVINKKSNKG